MRLTCDRTKFLEAFTLAAAVVPSRTPKPILENVRLKVEDSKAYLEATDLEIALRIEAEGVEVHTAGEALLPVRRFGSILREVPDEKLSIEAAGDQLVVRGSSSEFQLPTPDPLEYPPVFGTDRPGYHVTTGKVLHNLIRRTAFAIDPDSPHYALGGIYLEFSAERIYAVGTDGRRMAAQEGTAKQVGKPKVDWVVALPQALRLVDRAVGGSEEELCVCPQESILEIWGESFLVVSRLIEGRFPPWRDVLPRTPANVRFSIAAGQLLAGVRQAQIVVDPTSPGVIFHLRGGRLILSARGHGTGEGRIEIALDYEGPEARVRLNPKYLTDFLGTLESDQTLQVEFRGPKSPVVFTTGDGYTYILMPMAMEEG
ncbi:MAG: DNA polymerase III subunit beta [Thermoguttaceae bacterium]|nr:DNA polymerase III subunit beta [Thermoguttaceae bacterium]MDW8077841.1 DNA polymerase III subunit beta [Thermoguttaceae bacterium]